jgi:2-polyprenyl-6-methoxyphenol hydroxylase-like FAD-dependent oxidoreductase
MRAVAPDVIDEIVDSGAMWREPQSLMPPDILDQRDSITHDISGFAVINSRRPLIEAALRNHTLSQPNVEFRCPERVTGLSTKAVDGTPSVFGVLTEAGDSVEADIVIDAMGRRSPIDSWLREIGCAPPLFLSEPANELYYTRQYRLTRSDGLPSLQGMIAAADPFPWFAVLMFPGDNDTMQVAMGTLPEDRDMKKLRHHDRFHAVAMMAPTIGAWINPEVAEPITDVFPLGNLNNYIRRLVVDGDPVVKGIHLVGDSAAITNPQYGRGVSLAAGHGKFVADAIIRNPDDHHAQALVVDSEVERQLLPSLRSSVRMDRQRTATWRSGAGLAPQATPDSGIEVEAPDIDPSKLNAAFSRDPEVWYAIRRTMALVDPIDSWMTDGEILERIEAFEVPEPPPSPLPKRAEVLAVLD